MRASRSTRRRRSNARRGCASEAACQAWTFYPAEAQGDPRGPCKLSEAVAVAQSATRWSPASREWSSSVSVGFYLRPSKRFHELKGSHDQGTLRVVRGLWERSEADEKSTASGARLVAIRAARNSRLTAFPSVVGTLLVQTAEIEAFDHDVLLNRRALNAGVDLPAGKSATFQTPWRSSANAGSGGAGRSTRPRSAAGAGGSEDSFAVYSAVVHWSGSATRLRRAWLNPAVNQASRAAGGAEDPGAGG
jgi:hypothetical protein